MLEELEATNAGAKAKRKNTAEKLSEPKRQRGRPDMPFHGRTMHRALNKAEGTQLINKLTIERFCTANKMDLPNNDTLGKIILYSQRKMPADLLTNKATALAFMLHHCDKVTPHTKRNYCNLWTQVARILAWMQPKSNPLSPDVLAIFKGHFDEKGNYRHTTAAMEETREQVSQHTLMIFDVRRPCLIFARLQHAWVNLLPSVTQRLHRMLDDFEASESHIGAVSASADHLNTLDDVMLYIIAGIQILHPTQRIEIVQSMRLIDSMVAYDPDATHRHIAVRVNNKEGQRIVLRSVLFMPEWPEG